MNLDFFYNKFKENKMQLAIIWHDKEYTYEKLLIKIKEAKYKLKENNIKKGAVTVLCSDFNPISVAYLFALIENDNIIAPLSFTVESINEFYKIAEVENIIEIKNQTPKFKKINNTAKHDLLVYLKQKKHSGLILFSSGSTGKSKAAVHDFVPLLRKYFIQRKSLSAISFLLFDHMGGIDVLFKIFSSIGTLITIENRTPENVCKIIEKYNVEVLPTSPTFLNMILISHAHKKYDLSSLKIITYGTETMPEHILKNINKLYPNIKLKQTYGLTEFGTLQSKSKSNDSLWFKVGGEDYETKVVDNILYIKAKTSMLGYLNAPSPFDEDGWFNTQDKVEVDGEWIKILGRASDIINIGGQKVYPAEVESVLLEMDNINDISVFSKDNPIMGKVVAAKINLENDEPIGEFKKKIRIYCKNKLESYKIPVHIEISNEEQISKRFKKIR